MDKGQDALGSDLHMLSFVGGGGDLVSFPSYDKTFLHFSA